MIRDALRRFGYELKKSADCIPLEPIELPLIDVLHLLLRDLMKTNPEPFLVQIGAHDGASADPVHELVCDHHLPGLLVEPQPKAFRRLRINYRHEPQLRFENALLGSTDGTETFYTVREDLDGLPFWLHQSASLDRSVVANALRVFREVKGVTEIPPDYESLIETVAVPSLSWQTLLKKHAVAKVDILVVDTMGFDFEVIKLFPFDTHKPRLIHFEHSLLSPQDQRACLELLMNQGYSVAKVAVDTIACLDVKTRRWQVGAW